MGGKGDAVSSAFLFAVCILLFDRKTWSVKRMRLKDALSTLYIIHTHRAKCFMPEGKKPIDLFYNAWLAVCWGYSYDPSPSDPDPNLNWAGFLTALFKMKNQTSVARRISELVRCV